MKPIYATIFGIAVITSGLWRFLSAEGGHAGLWFGVVMGVAALLGALLFWKQQTLFGNVLTWASLLFVGGWFFFEAIVEKGFFNAEVRQLIVLVLTIAIAILMFKTKSPNSAPTPAQTEGDS